MAAIKLFLEKTDPDFLVTDDKSPLQEQINELLHKMNKFPSPCGSNPKISAGLYHQKEQLRESIHQTYNKLNLTAAEKELFDKYLRKKEPIDPADDTLHFSLVEKLKLLSEQEIKLLTSIKASYV